MNEHQSVIYLSEIIHLEKPNEFKIHLAVKNKNGDQPLDDFLNDFNNWKGWNSYRKGKDRFPRKYIFSMMDFYPQSGVWLFGGIFKILQRYDDKYEIELSELFSNMIGRLKIYFPYTSRTRNLNFERHFQKMSVHEILPKVYEGEEFRGFENIRMSFNELQIIFQKQRLDWKTALQSVSGIYLIVDKSNGKKYVGSAHGSGGIWSRWAQYISSGHGENKELKGLIHNNGIEHARKNFQFSLLEYMPASVSNDVIGRRESYWKKVLLSNEFGYNSN